jgi:hypothetical protein
MANKNKRKLVLPTWFNPYRQYESFPHTDIRPPKSDVCVEPHMNTEYYNVRPPR